MKKFLITCLIAISLISCYEYDEIPVAAVSFTTNQNGHGNVSFNPSIDDEVIYHWDFGDGNFSNEKKPSYTYSKNGEFNVTLSIKGNGGEAKVTEKIIVNDITGSISFWLSVSKQMKVEVVVDGKFTEIIPRSLWPATYPACGDDYTVTFHNLSEGKHTFEAVELNSTSPNRWMGLMEVTGGQCKIMGLISGL